MSLVWSAREREYIESSHISILARGKSITVTDRPQHRSRPPTRRSFSPARPITPAPSLISSDAMSPASFSTISPTTPVFDTERHRSPDSKSLHQRRPTPLDFARTSPGSNKLSTYTPTQQDDFDPASTYQPRRYVPGNTSSHTAQRTPTSASTDETSFIDWDDDPTTLQRMKQSLTFARPSRTTKTALGQTQPRSKTKNPDTYLNAIPQLRNPSRTRPQSRTEVSTPQTSSQTPIPTFATPRPPPLSTNSESRRQPADILYHAAQLEINDRQVTNTYSPPRPRQPYSCNEHVLPHSFPPTSTQPTRAKPVATTALPAQRSRPSRTTRTDINAATHQAERARYTHTTTSTTSAAEEGPVKSKRIRDIMHGVMKKVSMSDLRRESRNKGSDATR